MVQRNCDFEDYHGNDSNSVSCNRHSEIKCIFCIKSKMNYCKESRHSRKKVKMKWWSIITVGGWALLPPLWPEERAGTGEVWCGLSCQGWISCQMSNVANFMQIWCFHEMPHFCLNQMVQDKQTDRCYAAKHIRIRKPEQKEKVRLSLLFGFDQKKSYRNS